MRCCYSDVIAGQAGNDETNVIPNVIPDLIGDLIPNVIPDLIGDLKPNVPTPRHVTSWPSTSSSKHPADQGRQDKYTKTLNIKHLADT